MKKLVFELSPLMALLLILAVVMPVGFTVSSTTPAMAETVDNAFVTKPTTTSPTYVKSGGTLLINVTCNSSVTGDGYLKAQLFTAGETITPYYQFSDTLYPFTSGYNTGVIYTPSMPSSSIVGAGTYGLRVAVRAVDNATYEYSPIQTASVVVDNTAPGTPTLLLPANASCSKTATPTFTWSAITKTGQTILYNFQANTSNSFTSPAISVPNLPTPAYTPTLTDATWYWRVQSVDNATNTSAWSSARSICIDTAAPTQPNLDAVGTVGGTYNPTYSWSVSTDNSSCASIRYFVETFSGSCGGTLVDNVTGVANPQTGKPTITASNTLGAGTYWWRVTAYDCAGNTLGPTGCDTYTIPGSCTTKTINLGIGWNLASLPLCPTSATSITPAQLIALSDNTSAIQLIWGYDASSSAWQYYVPGSGGPLGSIAVDKGYWIQTSSPANITITGTSCPVPPQSLITATLYPGWNLVGFKSCTNLHTHDYFTTQILSAVSFICGYSGGWNCSVTTLETTKGYWVYYGGTTSNSYGLPCN